MSIKQLNTESYNKESILVGILWSNPDLFNDYNNEKLNKKTMGNAIWSFYLGLGRFIHGKNIVVFDDISVHSAVKELKLEDKFEKYGGYELIEELMEETKSLIDNFEGYYDEVKKYALLREYYKLFGEKVLEITDKYNYKKLNRNQISLYWNDKISSIDIDHNESQIEAENLLEGLEDLIDELDEGSELGMPFYRSKKLTESVAGIKQGTVTIVGSYSGRGKTSFITEKFITSCIINNEKLLIIANEQSKKDFQKMLLVTAMSTSEMYENYQNYFKDYKPFERKRINQGNFNDDEKEKMRLAIEWIREITSGNDALIKFVSVEEFTLDVIKKTVRKYSNRGYTKLLIDTMKPTEGGSNVARWEQFVQDFDAIYRFSRKGAGGLNLATVVTIQLNDATVGDYWLDDSCYGESRKIKNTVDVSLVMRPCFMDEYEGGSSELEVVNYVKRSDDLFNQDVVLEEVGEGKDYIKQISNLKHGKTYYLMFQLKNRFGGSTLTGGVEPMVYEVDFNSNRWIERGYARNVKREKSRW